MFKHIILGASALAAVAFIAVPASAQTGGAAAGAATGAVGGAVVGGPVGAVVGGVAGAVVGGIADDRRPKFKEYVVTQKPTSYTYKEDVRIGAVLPTSGVTYYDVPKDYGVTKYRYTVVNNKTVLVDPDKHTIIQIIE